VSVELDQQLWDRISTIFHRALDMHGDDRTAVLDQLCGSDDTIRREVEAMLDAHERSGGLRVERRLLTGIIEEASAGTLTPGARVGPYRIDSLVGAGGMGDVYRAERADGAYQQTVALKVLRSGLRTAEMVRRFRIERQALARLVHPGIATILDAGALDDGRPYIVLEYVDGVPVTKYCDDRALSLRDRLSLFLKIVTTVQFAHGRLVVHRDLKPSNIHVQEDGTPRLLDFGIAKLLDTGFDESLGVTTATDLRVLTPDYAAPEQLRGEAPTTATDVYALGVLLFELLTGGKPFRVSGRTVALLERAVLDTPAPAPSSVVKSTTRARKLRGDLDRIVLMALRKEPERRYVSAGQFGEDIERCLTGRPVMARPDSVSYRFSKFIGRNRAAMAAAAAAALLIVGFGVTAALQARRISRERDRAERERATAEGVLRILTDLFEHGNPNTHPGGDTLRVTSLLDDAERRVGTMSGDSVRQAALWRAVGNMRAARGEYARAIDLLTRSHQQRHRLFGPDDIEAARTRHELAQALMWYRGESVARPMLDSSLTELRRLLGESSPDVRRALDDLLMVTFDSVAARRLLDELADLDKTSPAQDPIAIAERLNNQAARYLNEGRASEAAALFRASLDILHRQLPPEHDNTRTVQRNLAMALVADGQFAQAESLQRAELAVENRRRGSLATRGMAEEALALTLAKVGRIDSAAAHERIALAAFQGGMGVENWRIWSAQRNLALLESVSGRLTEALALLDTAIDLARAGPDGKTAAGYLVAQRAPILIRLGRLQDAAQSIARAERELGTSAAVTPAHRADVERYAGVVELALGHTARAADRFRSAVALVESGTSRRSPPAANSCLLGVALVRLGRLAEAEPLVGGPCTLALAHGPNDPLVVEWIVKARAESTRRP